MNIRLGLPHTPDTSSSVAGDLTEWRGELYYRIAAYDRMDPFLVSVVSHSDLWMYASTAGGLTAGRRDSSHSLFPYETVDKLHHSGRHTGPQTLIRCARDDGDFLWEPFASDGRLRYDLERAVFKHALGCELWFEEVNRSLGLTFRYGWRPSGRFGWVRTAEIDQSDESPAQLVVLDGVCNLLPAGVHQSLQDAASCLVDAYKRAEIEPASGLALYRLTANIVDRAIASEALRATVAWQTGFDGAVTLLDPASRENVVRGLDPSPQTMFNGRRGAFLLQGNLEIGAGATSRWHIAIDTPVDHSGLARLGSEERTAEAVEDDIAVGRARLRQLLAGADAFQETGDPIASMHHVSNVLFNIARGGVPPHGYRVERRDFADFLETRNRAVAEQHRDWLASLPDTLPHPDLLVQAESRTDANLLRLCYEYLPLVFSRRHGDPSRPWNQFSIVMSNPDGTVSYAYQGNWRDIFQNWEALARSYPELLEPVIAKFVNASTVDGFNPYRITRDGIDWEISDPDDPWSSIGYWGDHQIVYLLKLLELSLAHHPKRLPALLDRDLFSYADVPYDIRSYEDIVRNPQDTIEFNTKRQRATEKRIERIGTDGRLVHRRGHVLHVNLTEKLLVPILAKLSNLVPGAGIWMNTMRPEWNDANNALVGNGVSVVTACYLYRHLKVCAEMLQRWPKSIPLSTPVVHWLEAVDAAVTSHPNAAGEDRARRAFMDDVGGAFSDYRGVYSKGMGRRELMDSDRIVVALQNARNFVGETILSNRREDGLYHAYNILHLGDDTARIDRLALMLEGQVAVLSSGLLEARAAVTLLDALRTSDLYREDQQSYVLYPVRELPRFVDKNRVPDSALESAPLLAQMLAAGDHSVVVRDAEGQLRFHPDLHNADAVRERLAGRTPDEVAAVLAAYEAVFNHKAFTGRSGTMYGYEGIGCIYWHMVAKLLLAVQETFGQARADGAGAALVDALRGHYDDVRAGLGFVKTPEEFGAFPLDPYSHTPGFAGARQPGMTGQVKEEILARWGELGVMMTPSGIAFDPTLLNDTEFLSSDTKFNYIDVDGASRTIDLAAGSLAFTYCQVPVVYKRATHGAQIRISLKDDETVEVPGHKLPLSLAELIYARSGVVTRIDVSLPAVD